MKLWDFNLETGPYRYNLVPITASQARKMCRDYGTTLRRAKKARFYTVDENVPGLWMELRPGALRRLQSKRWRCNSARWKPKFVHPSL
jgi:hypothetical protein